MKWRLLLAAVGVAAVGAVAARHRRTLSVLLLRTAAFAKELGPAGVALYAAAFVVATLLFVPTASLEMAAGLLFAPPYGMPMAMVLAGGSKLLACSVHFLLGRSLLRGYVERSVLPKFPVFRAASRLVATDSFKVTCAIRCAPIPSIAKNLGLASLGVPFSSFLLVTTIFSAPWTAGAVVVGSTLTSFAEVLDGRGGDKLAELMRPWKENYGVVALLCLIGAGGLVYISLAARRAYAEMLAAEEKEG